VPSEYHLLAATRAGRCRHIGRADVASVAARGALRLVGTAQAWRFLEGRRSELAHGEGMRRAPRPR